MVWVNISNAGCSNLPGTAYCNLSRNKSKSVKFFIKLPAHTNALISLLKTQLSFAIIKNSLAISKHI